MKECRSCHQNKTLEDFYPLAKSRSHKGDGHQAVCKECIKAKARSPERRQMEKKARAERVKTPEGRAKERERAKRLYHLHKDDPGFKERHKAAVVKWRRTEQGRETTRQKCALFRKTKAFKEAILRYREKFPEKRAAWIALWNALQSGKVIRPSQCSICGKECVPHGHHPDYSKPLEVIWCCHQCHNAFHWGRQ